LEGCRQHDNKNAEGAAAVNNALVALSSTAVMVMGPTLLLACRMAVAVVRDA
jgi:hypothetical protein